VLSFNAKLVLPNYFKINYSCIYLYSFSFRIRNLFIYELNLKRYFYNIILLEQKMKLQFISCIVLSILFFNIIKCENLNQDSIITSSIKAQTTSTIKNNWIRKIIGDINAFKKSREEAYLANFI
jgi:hypothetical protein